MTALLRVVVAVGGGPQEADWSGMRTARDELSRHRASTADG
ncbi:hypothetical protein ACI2LF_30215 [Kribbella sp. NPDC020789]